MKEFVETSHIRNFIDGLLLGDGYIGDKKPGALTSVLVVQQRHDRKEWIENIASFLNNNGIESRVRYSDRSGEFWIDGHKANREPIYSLCTLSYKTFKDYRKRWYKIENEKVIKRIPKDIDVSSPELLANWLCGDGSFNRTRLRKTLKFSTEGLKYEDVLWLKDSIKEKLEVSPTVTVNKKGPVFHLHRHADVRKFLELVQPFIPKCFYYKGFNADGSIATLDAEPYIGERVKVSKLTNQQIREIRRLHDEGVTQAKLSEMFLVAAPNINSIVRRKTWKHIEGGQENKSFRRIGSKHGEAKLTEEKVLEIRKIYAEGQITQKNLGKKYGVTLSVVNKVINRKGWTHI